jgi:RES domain-containing protein
MYKDSGGDAGPLAENWPVSPWRGTAWRMHRRKYLATDPGGSLKVSGRYNRGLDQFALEQTWPALYLAIAPETCLGELLRHVTVEHLPHLNDYRLSELSLDLEVICDCRDMSAIGLAPADLWHDTDFRVTQELAASTIARGAEGMLVPSATRLGDNLVLFPTQLRPTSLISVIGSRDPRLHVPRS